jgi:hypothetical protein
LLLRFLQLQAFDTTLPTLAIQPQNGAKFYFGRGIFGDLSGYVGLLDEIALLSDASVVSRFGASAILVRAVSVAPLPASLVQHTHAYAHLLSHVHVHTPMSVHTPPTHPLK